jgi:hypothetical protein
MVVAELNGGKGGYEFDWLVMAGRQGWEDFQVIHPKTPPVHMPLHVAPRSLAGGPPSSVPAESGKAEDDELQRAPEQAECAAPAVAIARENESSRLVASWPVSDQVEPGDVLILNPADSDNLYKCNLAADPMVVGIAAEGAHAQGQVHVTQYGTTLVKADAITAPIAKGDLLVTSATPGHAMKAQPTLVNGFPMYLSGTVIGKALEDLSTGTGLIRVLVMLR